MDVQFVASVAPIVRDADAARSFYRDALGLSFEGVDGDYVQPHELEGTKHFGLWPLSEAANACFDTTEWPTDIPVPQASIEFEVADVAAAAAELKAKGYRLRTGLVDEPIALGLEFGGRGGDVSDLELKAKGYRLIHEARTEPWTQITARLLSPEDLLVAVCYSPSFHDTRDS